MYEHEYEGHYAEANSNPRWSLGRGVLSSPGGRRLVTRMGRTRTCGSMSMSETLFFFSSVHFASSVRHEYDDATLADLSFGPVVYSQVCIEALNL